MATQSEQTLENNLIGQLVAMDYERVVHMLTSIVLTFYYI